VRIEKLNDLMRDVQQAMDKVFEKQIMGITHRIRSSPDFRLFAAANTPLILCEKWIMNLRIKSS